MSKKPEGPWFAVKNEHENGWWTVSRDPDGSDCVDDSHDGGFTENVARLIAAAPELLSALTECVEDSQAVVDQYVLNYGDNWRPLRLAAMRAVVAKARAVISKATGVKS